MPSVLDVTATITADVAGFTSGVQQAESSLTGLTSSTADYGKASATMAAGAVGVGAGLVDAIGAAGDFQSAMNNIGAVTGATTEQMSGLSTVALEIGQDTAFSAQEGAAAITELGKAGIPIPDIMSGAAMATADLAGAGEVDMARAAEVMSNAMNVWNLSGDQAANVADTLAAGANTSASSINDLALGMSQAGAGAAALGIPLEDTVATLAMLADAGMQGSDAGTSMKTMLARLTPATKPAREAFLELGLATAELNEAGETVINSKFFDDQGNFVGMAEASDVLYDSMKDLTDEQRAMAMETLFGSDASRAAELTFQAQKAAVEGTGRALSDYIDAVQPAGQAQDVAAAKMAGMNGALEALSGSIDTAKIAFGSAFLPVIESVAEGLGALVNVFIGLPAPIQTVISVFGAGVAAFLAVGAAVGFIIGPLTTMGPIISGLVGIVGTMAVPFLLVAAALAALYVAYQTNFLGFADGVNAVVGMVSAAIQGFIGVLTNLAGYFQIVVTDGDALNDYLANLPGWLQPIVQTVGEVISSLMQFADAFRNLFASFSAAGFDPITSALASLNQMFPQLNGVLEVAYDIWQNLIATFHNAAAAFQSIITAVQAGDLGGVLTGIFDLALALIEGFVNNLLIIGQGIIQAFQAIDWGAVSGALQSGLQNVSTAILTWVGEQSAALLTAFTEIDWSGVAAAVGVAWTVIQTAVTTGIEAVRSVVMEGFGALTAAVGPAWEAISTAISTAWATIQTTVGTALTTIQTTVSTAWAAIEVSITGALETTKATVLAAWTSIGETVALTMQTVTETVSSTWTGINETVSGILTTIQATISTAWATIQTTISTTLATIQTSISTAWGEIQSGATTAWQGIQTSISGVIETIKTTIVEGIIVAKIAFINILGEMAAEAATAMTAVKDAITGAFANAGSWLLDAGRQIMSGLAQGISEGLGGVLNEINGAVSSITGALGGLNVQMPSIGVSIPEGLGLGIGMGTPAVEEATTQMVDSASSSTASRLRSASPSQMFALHGLTIPQGLAVGVLQGIPIVEGAITDMADAAVSAVSTLHAQITAQVQAMLTDVRQGVAAMESAVASADLSTKGGKSKDKTKVKIDASGGHDKGKNANADAGTVRHGDVDRNADVKIDASGGRSRSKDRGGSGGGGGNVNIEQVVLRDERDLRRWTREQQRASRLASSRG